MARHAARLAHMPSSEWLSRWCIAVVLVGATISCSGCAREVSDRIAPVRAFKLERYFGTWYEIARLDHPFERGLSRVSARYEMGGDDAMTVLHRGFDAEKGRWREIRGVARLAGAGNEGYFELSLFWPFHSEYDIIELDSEHYQFAMVCGRGRRYLWILARDRQLDPELVDALVVKAGLLGFPTDELILTEQ